MFKDYYQILGILSSASQIEVKEAYRKQSLKWHPDKNPGVDVTSVMQDINEAYKILKDEISRARYDREYDTFAQQNQHNQTGAQQAKTTSWNYDYEIHDEDLKNDINEARSYAKDLVDEFFKNFKETSKAAAKGAWSKASGYLLAGILLAIISMLIRTCH